MVVFFPEDGCADEGGGALIRGVRTAVDCLMYWVRESRGEGARFAVGHSRV